jgi:hypothetical protein
MKKIIFIILLFSLNAFAQQAFEVKDASEKFDARIEVEKCDESFCEGKTTYTIFEKGGTKVFQKFDFENSVIQLGENEQPLTNITLLYDEQSALHFDDFNFDGVNDLALNDGNNGGYGSPSYQVYLFSKKQNKFVHSKSFTELAQQLGMFEVDAEKKMLFVFSKSGCCWHQTEGYSVKNNRPVKIYEQIEDATGTGDFVTITTKEKVNGKWRTSERKEKFAEEEDQ